MMFGIVGGSRVRVVWMKRVVGNFLVVLNY